MLFILIYDRLLFLHAVAILSLLSLFTSTRLRGDESVHQSFLRVSFQGTPFWGDPFWGDPFWGDPQNGLASPSKLRPFGTMSTSACFSLIGWTLPGRWRFLNLSLGRDICFIATFVFHSWETYIWNCFFFYLGITRCPVGISNECHLLKDCVILGFYTSSYCCFFQKLTTQNLKWPDSDSHN